MSEPREVRAQKPLVYLPKWKGSAPSGNGFPEVGILSASRNSFHRQLRFWKSFENSKLFAHLQHNYFMLNSKYLFLTTLHNMIEYYKDKFQRTWIYIHVFYIFSTHYYINNIGGLHIDIKYFSFDNSTR